MSDTATSSADIAPDDLHEESRALAWFMVVGGAVALLSAAILIVEKVSFLEDKAAGRPTALGCDFNAFVSCGGVINTPEASVFGFPNPLMGVVGWTVVLTLGVLLVAGVRFPRWIWAGLQLGVIFGIGLITWLQFQSIYDIGKLCPWCMVVWTIMIPTFVLVTARNLRAFAPGSAVTRFLTNWTALAIVLWYVVVASAIWFKFGDLLWA
ncbi:MAG: vitamin K epoxide reductase family protein [Actinomycetales bacterium]|nr:MAG: vitamin K epoxide reductase family protein [Actinomycetales bacterium]